METLSLKSTDYEFIHLCILTVLGTKEGLNEYPLVLWVRRGILDLLCKTSGDLRKMDRE